MVLIPDLENKLIRAAEREAFAAAAAAQPRSRVRRRAGKVVNTAAICLVMGVTLVIGGGALILLGGHKAPGHHPATGASGIQATRRQFLDILAVLRRPQTQADRAFAATGWAQPPRASGTRAVLDRPLIRLATTTPSGAQVFVVPLKIAGNHRSREAVALWVQGIGWSDYSTPADIIDGGAWGPFQAVPAANEKRLSSWFFEIVPDGVSKVVFYNLSDLKRPLRFNARISAHVQNNVAQFKDTGGVRIVFAAWYSPTGRLIKRVGDWSLTRLNPPRTNQGTQGGPFSPVPLRSPTAK